MAKGRAPSTQRAQHTDPGPKHNSGRLAGKVALITGSSRGIGRATAGLFAQEGAEVVLCARSRGSLLEAASAIRANGGRAVARQADISSVQDVRALIRFAIRRCGRIDILINNAGILGPRVPLCDYPIRDWERVLRVNLSGTFFMTREVAREMASRNVGCIVTLSSSVGRVGRARWGAYAVSKFGAEGLSQVLADELRSTGICVMTFNPGGTRTRMRAEAYPEENQTRLRDPILPAQALLRLVTRATMAASGKAFDLENLP